MVINEGSLIIDPQWYAVYTHSKSEKKVEERLTKAGFESYLPLQTNVKQWSDRKKIVKSPLISSYVFVKTHESNLTQVYEVPGVVNILKYLGNYAIVKNEEIENLKILIANDVPIQTIEPVNLTKGTSIIVTSGPFSGLTANYVTNSGKHRVIVKLEALNSFIEVTMPLSFIQEI